MHYLLEGMHSRICTPCADGIHPARQERLKRRLKSVLHSAPTGLGLPALPRRAIVCQTKRNSRHRSGTAPSAIGRIIQIKVDFAQLLLQHGVANRTVGLETLFASGTYPAQ